MATASESESDTEESNITQVIQPYMYEPEASESSDDSDKADDPVLEPENEHPEYHTNW